MCHSHYILSSPATMNTSFCQLHYYYLQMENNLIEGVEGQFPVKPLKRL